MTKISAILTIVAAIVVTHALVANYIDAQAHKTLIAPSIDTFQIDAKRWEFHPAWIAVRKGAIVRLTLTNLDADVVHGFSIPSFNVVITLEPGETKAVEFVADRTGTFPFSCSMYCGSGHPSMKGLLTVTF